METTEDLASQTVKEEPSSPVAMKTPSMNEDNPSCEVKSEKEETLQEDSTLRQGVPSYFTEDIKTEELDLPTVYKVEEDAFPCYYPTKLTPKAECNFDHEPRTNDDESSVYQVDPRTDGKIVTNKLNAKAFVHFSNRIDFQGHCNEIERNLRQSQQNGCLETKSVKVNIVGEHYGASDTADIYKIPKMWLFEKNISKSFVQLGQKIDQPMKDQNLKSNVSKPCSRLDGGGQIKETFKQSNVGVKTTKSEKGSNLKKGISSPTSKKPNKNNIFFSCKHCMKPFSRRRAMESHQLTHTAERPYSCKPCKKSYATKSHLKRHLRSHTGERYFCEHCKKSFSRKDNLKGHQRSHTAEKPYSCDYCKKSFSVKFNLIVHIRTHSYERPFSCERCQKSFSQKIHLISHIRTHTNERPFCCCHCNKSFSQKSNLVRHIQTHINEKPFGCDHCNKSFSEKSNLIVHIRTHTYERLFPCERCEKSFSRKHHLIRHIRTHTNERPYSCERCKKLFARNDILKKHLQTHACLNW